MSAALAEELDGLPAPLQQLLARHHFDARWLVALAARLAQAKGEENRVAGKVEPPADDDVAALPDPGSERAKELEQRGADALRAGECAAVVLAGGMATRMGGVVKALVEALPGRTFLDLRLAENRSVSGRAGRPVPLWLMTSHTTDGPIREALGAQLDGYHLATFPQRLSLRVTPDGGLFRDPRGRPSEHAPGHGDLLDALKDSGLLDRFVDQGGRTLMVANLDNLGATLDPLLIGWHLEHGKPVSCEVVDKVGSDRGGIPVRLDGRPVVLEEFRLPRGFDPARVRVFSTNSFHFDAETLEQLDMQWTYFIVEKTVEGAKAIQFERLIGEVTSYLDTRFVRVPRSGARSRFLPVKDREELEARKAELVVVARDRGMLD